MHNQRYVHTEHSRQHQWDTFGYRQRTEQSAGCGAVRHWKLWRQVCSKGRAMLSGTLLLPWIAVRACLDPRFLRIVERPAPTWRNGQILVTGGFGEGDDLYVVRDRSPIPELSLALIGNASGQTFGAERGSRSEAFSIRRLGGSRWRLRRTRSAMGFE